MALVIGRSFVIRNEKFGKLELVELMKTEIFYSIQLNCVKK